MRLPDPQTLAPSAPESLQEALQLPRPQTLFETLDDDLRVGSPALLLHHDCIRSGSFAIMTVGKPAAAVARESRSYASSTLGSASESN